MPRSLLLIALCLPILLATCARTTAPAAPPTVEDAIPPPATAEPAAAADRAQLPDAATERAPDAPPRGELPSEEEARAESRRMVEERRQTTTTETTVEVETPELADNQTALIENQGNVGNAPLTPSDDSEPTEPPVELPMMSYQKSACYGDCEVYTLKIDEEGYATLDVSEGLKSMRGGYGKQLTRLEYRDLMTGLDSLRSLELEAMYPVQDVPPTDIQFRELNFRNGEGQRRRVTAYYDAPPLLKRYLDRLDAFVREQFWSPLTPKQK